MTTPDEIRHARLVLANTAYAAALRGLLRVLTDTDAITPPAMKAKLAPALAMATKVIRAATDATDLDLAAIVDAMKPPTGTVH